MKEWKIERKARERVGHTKRDTKPQRKPRNKIEGLLSVDKSTCPYCQEDHFTGRCNIVTNVNDVTCQQMSTNVTCTKRGH